MDGFPCDKLLKWRERQTVRQTDRGKEGGRERTSYGVQMLLSPEVFQGLHPEKTSLGGLGHWVLTVPP